jgi:hypothetical protein
MEDINRKNSFEDKKEGKIENYNVNKNIYINNNKDEMIKNKDKLIGFSLNNNSNDIQIKSSFSKEFFSEKEKKYNDIYNNQDKEKANKSNEEINNIDQKKIKNYFYIKDFILVNKLNYEILRIKERLIQLIIKKEYQKQLI